MKLSELPPIEVVAGLKLKSAIGTLGKIVGVDHDRYEGRFIYIKWETGAESQEWLYNLDNVEVVE